MNAFSFFVQDQKFHGISVIWFFINLFKRWIYVLYFYESDNFKISWSAPENRSDNSPLPLSEIAGYRVYYGSESGKYTNKIEVDSNTQSVTVTDLSEGRTVSVWD